MFYNIIKAKNTLQTLR